MAGFMNGSIPVSWRLTTSIFQAGSFGLETMASYIGFSKYHFSRLFKEHTNSTFYDYLSRKRIQAAQEMLLAGESITSIAFQTGFNNPASFSRCFKKYTKYNPTEFRSQFSLSSIP